MAPIILLVDDEVDLTDALGWTLRKEGFVVRTASNGVEALAQAQREPLPGLVLLDVMLPDLSGIEVCRRLKAEPATAGMPVIMLTARGEELDRVMGFEVGVDDYVVKPFSARELLLRIRAVLRRNGAESLAEVRPITVFGSLRIDREAHRVWVGEVEVELTAMELRLLDALFQRRGRVQSRDQLVESVWGDVGMVTERAVDTQVKRLRSKLGEAGDYIETLRGVGYRFAERPERLT